MKRGLKHWVRLVGVGLVGSLVFACIFIELSYISGITQPAASVVGDPPYVNDEIEYLPVTLHNEKDDIQLSGWYVPSKNRAAVILLHGFDGNRLGMKPQADVLARHGYGVLLYDLRGHGESGGDVRAFGWEDVEDVNAALEFLSAREEVDPDRIGIVGFSIGGQIAIRATAGNEQLRAIIADDPGFVTVDDAPGPANTTERVMYMVSWIDGRGVSVWTGIPIPPGVIEVIGDISPRPILFIDTAGSQSLIRHYYELAGEPKELWEIPEAYHGAQFQARPLEYEEKMITFFDDALLKE